MCEKPDNAFFGAEISEEYPRESSRISRGSRFATPY